MLRVVVLWCLTLSVSSNTHPKNVVQAMYSPWFNWFKIWDYAFTTTQGSWNAARIDCEVNGGDLLWFYNQAELKAVKSGMGNNSIPGTWLLRNNSYSVISPGQPQHWVWRHSHPIDATTLTEFWAPGEPDNNSGEERCVGMYTSSGAKDMPCTSIPLPWICKKLKDAGPTCPPKSQEWESPSEGKHSATAPPATVVGTLNTKFPSTGSPPFTFLMPSNYPQYNITSQGLVAITDVGVSIALGGATVPLSIAIRQAEFLIALCSVQVQVLLPSCGAPPVAVGGGTWHKVASPPGQTVDCVSMSMGDVCTLRCTPGYTLLMGQNGNANITCGANGLEETKLPECAPIGTPSPAPTPIPTPAPAPPIGTPPTVPSTPPSVPSIPPTGPPPTTPPTGTGVQWVLIGDIEYAVVSGPPIQISSSSNASTTSITTASSRCKALGGALAKVGSTAVMQNIVNLVNKQAEIIIVGGSNPKPKAGDKSGWSWDVDKTPIDEGLWGGTSLDNQYAPEGCLVLDISTAKPSNRGLDDVSCTKFTYTTYLCQKGGNHSNQYQCSGHPTINPPNQTFNWDEYSSSSSPSPSSSSSPSSASSCINGVAGTQCRVATCTINITSTCTVHGWSPTLFHPVLYPLNSNCSNNSTCSKPTTTDILKYTVLGVGSAASSSSSGGGGDIDVGVVFVEGSQVEYYCTGGRGAYTLRGTPISTCAPSNDTTNSATSAPPDLLAWTQPPYCQGPYPKGVSGATSIMTTVSGITGGNIGASAGIIGGGLLLLHRCGASRVGAEQKDIMDSILQPLYFLPVGTHDVNLVVTTFVIHITVFLLHLTLAFGLSKLKKMPLLDGMGSLRCPNLSYALILVTYQGLVLGCFDLIMGRLGGNVFDRVMGIVGALLTLLYAVAIAFIIIPRYLLPRCVVRHFTHTPLYNLHLHPDVVPIFPLQNIVPDYYWYTPEQPSILQGHSLLIAATSRDRYAYYSEPVHFALIWLQGCLTGVITDCKMIAVALLCIAAVRAVLFIVWRHNRSMIQMIALAAMQVCVLLQMLLGSVLKQPPMVLLVVAVVTMIVVALYLLHCIWDFLREVSALQKLEYFDRQYEDGSLNPDLVIPDDYDGYGNEAGYEYGNGDDEWNYEYDSAASYGFTDTEFSYTTNGTSPDEYTFTDGTATANLYGESTYGSDYTYTYS